MKAQFYAVVFTICFILAVTNHSLAQNKSGSDIIQALVPSPIEFMLDNTNMGTNFWVAIPQNGASGGTDQPVGIEIVVGSIRKTEVTMRIPDLDIIRTKSVEALTLTSFSSKNGDLGWTMEATESDQATRKGIHITSPEPISVYVITVRKNTGDGYMAIPVDKWGSEYYHCSYFDYHSTTPSLNMGGGFIVLASENGTSVNITLDGTGVGKTPGNHKIGDQLTFNLDSGQIYMIKGDGTTTGLFDLSGSKIKASKPVGVISFHQKTMIPSICPSDEDHLCEMVPPVDRWGKLYVTVQLDRHTSGSQKGEGDLFRVVASEDNTNVSCVFYDLSNNKLGDLSIPLNKSCDFSDVMDIRDINSTNTKKSVRGVALWEANKPFMLIQNAFSGPWDGDIKYDGMSIVVPPVNQFVKNTVFQTPYNTESSENYITLYVQGDATDTNAQLLKSVTLDGQPVHIKDPKFILNRMPGTSIYWTRINITTGCHVIKSNTRFSGYLVSLCSFNSVGYPLTSAYNLYDTNDVTAPRLTFANNCGDFSYEAKEPPTEQGISNIIFFRETSTNYNFTLDRPELFKPQLKILSQKFFLKVADKSKPAKAYFAVLDRAGNYSIDSCYYEPDKIAFSQNSLNFGNIKVGLPIKLNINVYNKMTIPVNILNVTVKTSKFVLTSFGLPKNLLPSDSLNIEITYTPTVQSVQIADYDTLTVVSNCSIFKIIVSGGGIMPTIAVQDFDFGEVLKNTKICIEETGLEGYKITNPGTDTLHVTGITVEKVPFIINSPTEPELPFAIKPGGEVHLKSICFIPPDTGSFSSRITITSDAMDGTDNGLLTGRGKSKPDGIVENNILGEPGFEIFPNPVNDFIEIKNYPLSGNPHIQVFSIEGTKVLETVNFNRIDASNLQQGVYYCTIKSGQYIGIRKFVVIR